MKTNTMVNHLLAVALLLSGTAVGAAAAPAGAGAAPQSKKAVVAKIAVVNFEEIVNFEDPSKSKAIEWADRMTKLEQSLRPQISKIQDKENTLKAKLQKAQAEKSQDEEVKADLMRLKNDIEIEAEKYKKVSAKRFEDERAQFGDKIQKVVQVVAKEQGWTHVLPGPLLFAVPECDITSDVIEQLNKEFRAEQRAKSFAKPASSVTTGKQAA